MPITMHANDNITVSLKKKGSKYDATALVTVIDADSGTPVSGATVLGAWTVAGIDVGTGQSSTDSNGETSVTVSRVSAQSGNEIRYTVTGIVRGNDIFDDFPASGFAIVP